MTITDVFSVDENKITFTGSESDTLGNGVSAVDLKGATIVDIVGIGAIGAFAFNSTSLTSINIPPSVTIIGVEAFSGASNLTSITIPSSVTDIGSNAFYYAINLTSITVDLDNINYSSSDGVLFNKANTILIQYPIGNNRTTYEIPPSVTDIHDSAFFLAKNLTSITFTSPSSVTTIGNYAFQNATSLTSITIPQVSKVLVFMRS